MLEVLARKWERDRWLWWRMCKDEGGCSGCFRKTNKQEVKFEGRY